MDSAGQESLIRSAYSTVKNIIGEQKKTLCVGVGDGTELKYFRGAYGIDINDKSIEKCREENFNVSKMDMHKMTFQDGVFDLVFSKDNFEHSVSHIEVISEFARVSRRYVAIVLPDESWQCSGWHFIIPNMKQMISLGEKVGLSLRAFREYDVLSGTRIVGQFIYIYEKF
jgi:ubiquinone/menaquinone biosynthesis C-methylase UbiE